MTSFLKNAKFEEGGLRASLPCLIWIGGLNGPAQYKLTTSKD